MAKITYSIGQRKFEQIRDKLSVILADELSNQATLQLNTLFNAGIWLERFIPFDQTELPAINIYYQSTPFLDQTPITNKGEHTYNIDIHTKGVSTPTQSGDSKATFDLHRLIGVVQAVLMDPNYIRLDFPTSFGIQNRQITDFRIAQPERNKDGLHIVAGRLVMKVSVNEETNGLEGIALDIFSSQFRINDTEKGYKIEKIN